MPAVARTLRLPRDLLAALDRLAEQDRRETGSMTTWATVARRAIERDAQVQAAARQLELIGTAPAPAPARVVRRRRT